MKTLYLVRHAKSSWANANTGDFDRPLNERGLKSATLMAALLKEKKVLPEMIVTSPANRAITTADIFCDTLEFPKVLIQRRIEIYEGGTGNLLNIVQQLPDSGKTVMLFGHNPTITEFSNLLSGHHIDSMVTCSVARIDMAVESWKDAAKNTGKLVWYEFPKKHD